MRGIGGRQESSGTNLIQIPFRNMHIVIDLKFCIIPEDTPLVPFTKDIVENVLDISIQSHHVSLSRFVDKVEYGQRLPSTALY